MGNPDAMSMGNPDAMSMGNPDAMSMGNPDATSMGNPDAMVDAGPAPCNQPMLLCGNNDCIDPSADPNHCGACDYSCGEGACLNGQCEAFDYFYSASNRDIDVIRIHTDSLGAMSLVWTEVGSSGEINMRSASNISGFPTTIASSVPYPQDLQIDGDTIWYSDMYDGTTKAGRVYYRTLPINSNNPAVDVTTQANSVSRQVYSIAVGQNGAIYWYAVSSSGGLRIRSYQNNNLTEYTPPNQTGSYAYFITVVGGYVYWQSGSGTLYRTQDPLAGFNGNQQVAREGITAEPRVLAKSSTKIFWGEDVSSCANSHTPCKIYMYDTSAGQINPIYTFPSGEGAYGLFLDEVNDLLYYTSGNANNYGGSINRIELTRFQNEQLHPPVNTQTSLRGIVKIGDFIYWAQNTGNNHHIRGLRIQ